MNDFVNDSQKAGFYFNDDFSSWFGDFGEDWK